MTVYLAKWPRTSPYRTSGSCADGVHEGMHRFKGRGYTDDPCEECGQAYRSSRHIQTRLYDYPCRGEVSVGKGTEQCQCLCHPANRTRSHWHIVNSGGPKKTICLGHVNLLDENLSIIRAMPPRAYLKRIDGNDDDACWERTYPPRVRS